ncbi:MAG: Gfo/Idh/MocA family oxidoreductase [Verrucomicrobia bacterium]|nr:Gfo/Idh/MocA family oxidoreductase [Verrucomicrobiota bacterium]
MNTPFATNRRSFLKQIAVAGFAAPFVTRGLLAASPNGKLNHAAFGASGMSGADLNVITHHDFVNLVAVAEVDLKRAANLKQQFPNLKVYQDWREMLDKEKSIDCANVSTPDHQHAPMAMSAMQRGIHVYCQKPLTHDLHETRQLTLFAREKKLATQMGIQIHSQSEYRLAVRLIRDLVIGKVKEVHTWSSKKWGDTEALPGHTDPVPADFNWDLWLGVCAQRPFIGGGYYHPGNWRKRLDFGTGTFGDMGCHIYDPVFDALKLTAPLSVRSEGPAPNQWNWAVNAVIHYLFPGTEFTADKMVEVTWYDGDARPPKAVQALLGNREDGKPYGIPDQGSIFIGTKGVLLLPHIAKPKLFPQDQFAGFPMPKVQTVNHWTHWLEACRGNGKAWANFDYSGPLTEAVLLGSVATRFPKTTLAWDAAAMKFKNVSEANQFVRRTYRAGWEVKGLS